MGEPVNAILCLNLSLYLNETRLVGLFFSQDGILNSAKKYSEAEFGALSTSLFLMLPLLDVELGNLLIWDICRCV